MDNRRSPRGADGEYNGCTGAADYSKDLFSGCPFIMGNRVLSLKYLLFSRVARDAGSPALSSGGLHCESTHKSQVCEIVYFNFFDTFLAFRFRKKYL